MQRGLVHRRRTCHPDAKGWFAIAQIGVDYFPRTRGVSTLSSPAVIKKILIEMHRLRGELKALPMATRE